MMTRLITWFIELQNRFNESRLSKILMIYVLNWVNNLTSWQCATHLFCIICKDLSHADQSCFAKMFICYTSNQTA